MKALLASSRFYLELRFLSKNGPAKSLVIEILVVYRGVANWQNYYTPIILINSAMKGKS